MKISLRKLFAPDFLAHIITEEALGIEKKNVSEGIPFYHQRVDDEFLINLYFNKKSLFIFSLLSLLLFPIIFYVSYKPSDGEMGIGFFVVFMLVALVLFVYSFTSTDRRIIFDRMNGLITYPGFLWEKPKTIPFEHAKVYIGAYQAGGFVAGTILNIMINNRRHSTLAMSEPKKVWSLYVWYMDKNRPLPRGTAFDPYRERDYERRKAEGFPSPLYPSSFKITEYKPLETKTKTSKEGIGSSNGSQSLSNDLD